MTSRVHLPVSFRGSWRIIPAVPVSPLLDTVYKADDDLVTLLVALLMDDDR